MWKAVLAAVLAIAAGAVAGILSVHAMIGPRAEASGANASEWRRLRAGSGDPYALLHFLGQGHLPPAQDVVYTIDRDSEGSRLDDDCLYRTSIAPAKRRWWILSAGAASGPASLLSGHVIAEPSGAAVVLVGRDAQPGNWVNARGTGGFTLTFTVHGVDAADDAAIGLSRIDRISCR